jgi:hypothetical protein
MTGIRIPVGKLNLSLHVHIDSVAHPSDGSLPADSKKLTNHLRVRVRVRVTLQLTVSQSVRLGDEPRLGLKTRYLFLYESYCPVYMGRPL